jgi:hypothetical protein
MSYIEDNQLNEMLTSEFDQYLYTRHIDTKYVNPYDPYSSISPDDMNTIILPDLSNLPMSNIIALDDTSFSECLDNILFNFNLFSTSSDRVCHMFFNKIEDYFLRINLTTFQISISIDTVAQIMNCLTSNTLPIVILPVRIDFLNIESDYAITLQKNDSNLYTAHSNLIIIDKLQKTVEFFEPHGIILSHAYSNILHIESIIQNFLTKTFELTGYTFINISTTCPIGAQTIQSLISPESGHCLAWSLYFIMVRLLNIYFLPTQETVFQTINKIITSQDAITIDTTIRQFLSYIESLAIIPTRFFKAHNTYDISNYIENKTFIELRLRHLINVYFKNAIFYHQDFRKIFEEIISYKNIPNFDKIFIEEISNSYNTNNNDNNTNNTNNANNTNNIML